VFLQISDAVIWQETADGASLYNTETGDFLSLNETGARIWALVADGAERAKIISKLSLQFAGTHAVLSGLIHTDIHGFIDSMIEGGLMTEAPMVEGSAAP
jgi:hypothetical protein